jgi:tRNA (guanine10-N2)-dimethyltransferase
MKIFLLSKENIELGKEEVISLTKSDYELYDNLLITNIKLDLSKRLGYTHKIFDLLFTCKPKNLLKKIDEFDWGKIYDQNFCVRSHSNKYDEKEIAGLIFKKLKNPRVKLRNSKTEIHFFVHKKEIFVTKFITNVDKSYLLRKAHMRPSLHPTSMSPRLARACINLTGLTKGTLLDPFCGSGGLLIESYLMGFNATGYDIDKIQIKRAKKNLDFYDIKNYNIKINDATKITGRYDCIVSDLPYGKGSKASALIPLYLDFLKNGKNLTKNMIIVLPNFIDYKDIIKKTDWKIKNKFEIYIHKSLTRIVLKLVLN